MESPSDGGDDAVASPEKVSSHLTSLSAQDRWRIDQVARIRIESIGRAAKGRDYQDLIQDAATLMLEGRRKWKYKQVSFVVFFAGIIKSVASHWAEKFEPREAVSESQLGNGGQDVPLSNPLGAKSSDASDGLAAAVSVDERTREQLLIEKVKSGLEEDPIAYCILDELQKSREPAEIRAVLGISGPDYDKAMKRIRWAARAISTNGDQNA